MDERHSDSTRHTPFAWASLLAVLAVGVWANAPVLSSPRHGDDLEQFAWLRGVNATSRSPLDLFSFVRAGELPMLRAQGAVPWWADDTLRVRVFRPLTSLSIAADVRVFGDSVVPAHVHSLLWWALLAMLAFALLRRRFSAAAATVGVATLALHPAWTITIHWLCNRAEVLCGVAMLALWWIDAPRAPRSPQIPLGSLALSSLAALAGEYALPFALLPLALTWFDGRGRRASIATFAGVPAAIMLAARVAGFRIEGSGTYVDPLVDPARFLHELPLRLSWMARAVGAPWALAFPGLASTTITATWTAAGVVLAAVARALGQRVALVSLAVALLTLVPLAASVPAVRLLGPFALALGWAFAALWDAPAATAGTRIARGVARGIAVLWMIVSALASHHLANDSLRAELARQGAARHAWQALRAQGITRGVVVSVVDPDIVHLHTLIARLADEQGAISIVVGAAARGPVLLRRVGATRYVLQSTGAPLLFPGDLYRAPGAPLEEGTVVTVGDLRFTAESVVEGRPGRIVIDGPALGLEGGVRLLRARGVSVEPLPILPVNAAMLVDPG